MEWSIELQNYAPLVAQRFEMTPLSSKLVPQNSKMRRRGSKISPRAGGLTVGRSWVARGSVGRSRVAYSSSRSGNTRVADPHRFEYIQLYSLTVWPPTRADPRRGAPKKSC